MVAQVLSSLMIELGLSTLPTSESILEMQDDDADRHIFSFNSHVAGQR